MAECNRCGKCCYIPTGEVKADGTEILRPCKYLIKISENKFHCRNYKNRLGTEIGRVNGLVYRCVMYNSMSREITGCPLNLGGKPLEIIEIKGTAAWRLPQREEGNGVS